MEAIAIKNLNKVYNESNPTTKKALSNINLSVDEGLVFGLLGPNGAGKSTLINILGTVVTKTSGSISIMGYDLDKNTTSAKKSIGIVPQEVNFSPFLTPLNLLMFNQGLFGMTPSKKKCMELLDFMELADKANNQVRMLSGGMKRRVLIARAMAHSPKVLILDEPTAGVDIDLRKRVWDGIKTLNKQGTTIILTTHYLEEAENLCSKIAIINKGKLIINDTKASLMSKFGSSSLTAMVKEGWEKLIPDALNKLIIKKADNELVFSYRNLDESGFIVTSLIRSGIDIKYISTDKTRLEDVFLLLTK